MNKQKINSIMKFTLREYFESKFFIIFNIVTLISCIVGFNFNSFKQVLNIPDKEIKYEIEVIDNLNIIYSQFVENFDYSGDYEIKKSTHNDYTKDNIKEENIIIEIEENEKSHFKATITSKQSLEPSITKELNRVFSTIQNKMYESDFSLQSGDIELILNGPEIETVFLAVVSEGYLEKIFIKYIAGAITMFIAMLIFSKIGSDIAQEKQSKSSEYILTTVSSKDYLLAKVFGNILFVIIQFLLMIIFIFVGVGFSNLINISSLNVDGLAIETSMQPISKDLLALIGALTTYNVLTLILLSFVQGALSAKSTSIQDASNSSLLLVSIYTILFISTMGVIDQYTTPNIFMYIVSTIPVISSFFVPAMMIIGQSTPIQIIVSIILLIIAIPISFNYSEKKFKEGILNYSKQKKSLEEDETSAILNKRKFSRLGSVLGIGIIIFLGSNVILSLVLQVVLNTTLSDTLSKTDIMIILQMIVSSISLYVTYKYIMSHVEKVDSDKKKKKLTIKIIIITFGIMAILQIILGYVFTMFHIDYDVTAIFDISSNSPLYTKILFVIAIALIPAIFEELFCRKAIISLLKPHGTFFALFISSFIFGLIHMNLQQFIFAFLIGLVLALVYDYTKNIKHTMFIHFVNNFISILPLLFGNSFESIVTYIYIIFIVLGALFAIYLLTNSDNKSELKEKLSKAKNEYLSRSKPCYLFIINDFMFDIAIVALLLLSIYQQNLISLLQ